MEGHDKSPWISLAAFFAPNQKGCGAGREGYLGPTVDAEHDSDLRFG